MKKFISIIAIVLIMVVVVGCSNNSTTTKDDFLAFTNSTLDKSFSNAGFYHSARWDGDTLIVETWGDNIVEAVAYAVAGNYQFIDAWEGVVDTSVDLCSNIVSAANANGLNIDVEYHILNNHNLDNSLLVIKNGVVMYDVVK